MEKIKKLIKKELELKDFKPKNFDFFRRMDVTRTGAFKDARKLINEGKPSVGIYWIPDPQYTYKVTDGLQKGWKKKGWQKIIEISEDE